MILDAPEGMMNRYQIYENVDKFFNNRKPRTSEGMTALERWKNIQPGFFQVKIANPATTLQWIKGEREISWDGT